MGTPAPKAAQAPGNIRGLNRTPASTVSACSRGSELGGEAEDDDSTGSGLENLTATLAHCPLRPLKQPN